MRTLRFAIIGSGFRSLFYLRIARAIPERFDCVAMLCRSDAKAAMMRTTHGVHAVTSVEEVLAAKPDFVVVAVNHGAIAQVSLEWMRRGTPVVAETPVGVTVDELRALWDATNRQGLKLQVAEQYWLQPMISAALNAAQSGWLGTVDYVVESQAHDYHGLSLIRKALDVGHSPVRITGTSWQYSLMETDSRQGPIAPPHSGERTQRLTLLEFEGGRRALHDFTDVQYRSFLRSQHLTIRGSRGEIADRQIRMLNANDEPVSMRLTPQRSSVSETTVSVCAGDHVLYRNPFPLSGLRDDETAIATMMDSMEQYLDSGAELYPLADALQDSYLSILLTQACNQPGTPIASKPQPWNK